MKACRFFSAAARRSNSSCAVMRHACRASNSSRMSACAALLSRSRRRRARHRRRTKRSATACVTEFRADVTIDASGRNTLFPDWLRADGVEVFGRTKPRRHPLFHAALSSARRPGRTFARRPARRRRSGLYQIWRLRRRQSPFLDHAGGAGNRNRTPHGHHEARDRFDRICSGDPRCGALDGSGTFGARKRCLGWAI